MTTNYSASLAKVALERSISSRRSKLVRFLPWKSSKKSWLRKKINSTISSHRGIFSSRYEFILYLVWPPLHHQSAHHLSKLIQILLHNGVLPRRLTLQPPRNQIKILRIAVLTPIFRTKFYISQIVLALEYMHSRDIVYRDLKPENIMIDKKGYIKLTDFGLSKKIKRGQENIFSISGMPEYTAPEIILQQDCSKAVDFWCLGSLLHEMVTGFPPFFSENLS